MGFSRQEYWSGLPFPSPRDPPNPGIESRSPALQGDALTSEWNKFKGLDLIECLMNYGRRFVTLYRRQGSRHSPRKMKKSKMAVWRGLKNSCESKRRKSKREKERYKYLKAEFQRIARRDKKAFFRDQCKEIEENNRMGKTRDLFKKIRNTKGTFHERWAR